MNRASKVATINATGTHATTGVTTVHGLARVVGEECYRHAIEDAAKYLESLAVDAFNPDARGRLNAAADLIRRLPDEEVDG